MLISDAAVNVTPDLKTRQQAIRTLVETAHALGIETPNVAILSATETPIASIPSSMDARELCKWAEANVDAARFAGPLSFDLSVAPEAVEIKAFQAIPLPVLPMHCWCLTSLPEIFSSRHLSGTKVPVLRAL